MHHTSSDETYMQLITIFRDKLKILTEKIKSKVYIYGFLKV